MEAKTKLWQQVRKSSAEIPHSKSARTVPLRLAPCPNEGAILSACTTCGGGDGHHVRACEIHGKCSRLPTSDPTLKVCRSCDDHPARKPAVTTVVLPRWKDRFKWVSTTQLIQDSVALAGMVPSNASGIVGVPRSGMLPASVIATHLHLPLLTVEPSGLRMISPGSRGGSLRQGTGPLFVVDDTVYAGSAMQRARSVLRNHPCLYAAVYVRPEALSAVDFAARELPSPHLLEWNMLNNGPVAGYAAASAGGIYGRGVATDLDGILCHDEESGGRPGTPYLPARQHVLPLIVTGRKESTRAGTEAWLAAQGIRFERLEMFPDAAPFTWREAAIHKAHHYGNSACGFYVESCPEQARIIFEQTGKPVICPIINTVFYGEE